MNRLIAFEEQYKKHIAEINVMCDPDHPDNSLPEYREAARLCKFLLERETIYDLFLDEEISSIHNIYDDARCFAMLCDRIYHAIVDDGDICFVKVTNNERILFQNRWEVTLETASTKNEKLIWKSVEDFTNKREQEGKPVKNILKPTLEFYNNSIEFLDSLREFEQV
jgi:hypothetical protein